MALIHVHYYSPALNMQRGMDVVMPQRSNGVGQESGVGGGKLPVLYLLHGGSDNHTIWQRRTSIERYAVEKGLAVIMPATDLGFYADMKYGYDFYTHIAEELPGIVQEFFPNLSTRREDTFVAGLSMGGFGAMKMGIHQPERFAAVASLSGMLNLEWEYEPGQEKPRSDTFYNIYGSREEMKGSINDIPHGMEQLIASGKELPKFFVTCGTEDFLYEINVDFRDRFQDRIDLTYHEEPGVHEWGYWDRNIQRILDWLPLEANREVK